MQIVQKSTGQIVTVPDTVGPISVGPNGDPMQLIPYGYLLLPVPVADGFVRIATGYVDSGDGVHSIPFPADMSQADYDAMVAAVNAKDAEQKITDEANAALALAAQQAHDATVAGLRATYRTATNQFCTVAGIAPIVDKFEDASVITDSINASSGATQVALFMLSMQIKYAIDELRRPSMDGDTAWDRI